MTTSQLRSTTEAQNNRCYTAAYNITMYQTAYKMTRDFYRESTVCTCYYIVKRLTSSIHKLQNKCLIEDHVNSFTQTAHNDKVRTLTPDLLCLHFCLCRELIASQMHEKIRY